MTTGNENSPIYRITSVVLVSLYLFFVGLWLVITRQIPAPGLKKIVKGAFRPLYKATLTHFQAEKGYCWTSEVPDFLLSDKEAASTLQLTEDGRLLGPAHAPHDDIRRHGSGRYSHWATTIYFSTSDNSDPRTNGRRYSVAEKRS